MTTEALKVALKAKTTPEEVTNEELHALSVYIADNIFHFKGFKEFLMKEKGMEEEKAKNACQDIINDLDHFDKEAVNALRMAMIAIGVEGMTEDDLIVCDAYTDLMFVMQGMSIPTA